MKIINLTVRISVIAVLTSSLYAQSVDEILAKHFEAVNQEKLSTINSLRLEATMFMMGQEMPMTILQKRPNKIRSEVEIQGQKILTVYDGIEGWMVNPMMGSSEPQRIPPAQLENIVKQSDFFDSELVDYTGKGHTIEKLGDNEDEGNGAYVLQLNHKNGQVFKFYIDKINYMILKTSATVNNMGTEMEVESYQKDYKKVDDIMFAHRLEIESNGQNVQTTKISNIELNISIKDNIFEKASLTE